MHRNCSLEVRETGFWYHRNTVTEASGVQQSWMFFVCTQTYKPVDKQGQISQLETLNINGKAWLCYYSSLVSDRCSKQICNDRQSSTDCSIHVSDLMVHTVFVFSDPSEYHSKYDNSFMTKSESKKYFINKLKQIPNINTFVSCCYATQSFSLIIYRV
jgi:hypothetical protein